MTTLAKYNININPKTLKYYHDRKHEEVTKTLTIEPTPEATQEQPTRQEQPEPTSYIEAMGKETHEEEEETLTEAIEQEPEAIPTTEAHRMMATMIRQYAKKYREEMEEKPKTEEDKNLEDATNYFKTWSTDKIEQVEPTTPTPTNDSGEWEEAMTAEELQKI